MSRLLGAEGEAVHISLQDREGSCDQAGAGPGLGRGRAGAGKSVSSRGGAGKLGSSSRLEDRLGFH